jgi:hypothetical protein
MALFLSYPQYPQNSQRKKEAKKESTATGSILTSL